MYMYILQPIWGGEAKCTKVKNAPIFLKASQEGLYNLETKQI